jgi:hypothetical protein
LHIKNTTDEAFADIFKGQDNEINEINVTNSNSIRLVENEGLPGTIETSGGQTTNRYKENS